MSDDQLDLRAFRDETRPDDDAVAALQRRIMAEAEDEPLTGWLSQLPAPGPHARTRVKARLASARPVPRWQPVAALAAVLAMAVAVWGWRTTRPSEPVPQVAAPAPAVTTSLNAPDRWQTVQVEPFVHVEAMGAGEVVHQGGSTDITWSLGELRVAVTPQQGRAVTVRTPEAEVRVVGTEFSVLRDVSGTAVEVQQGEVEVTCASAPALSVSATGSHHCLPATALDLLTLANRMERDGAPAEEILGIVERGLSMGPGAQEAELLLHQQLRALDRADQAEAALAAAESYLDAGYRFRHEDVLRIAVRRALETGGCQAAAPRLAPLDPQLQDQLAPGCRP